MTAYLEIPLIGKIKHPSRWLIGLVAASVLVTGTATTYTLVNRDASEEDIAALTVPVQANNITLRITASGRVVPVQSVNISPKQPGIVASLRVEQGDRVQQGQVIAVMDSAEIQAQILQYRANLEQAQAQLAEAQAGSRPQEIAQARARLAQAQAQLAEARAGSRQEEIAKAEAQVNQYQAQLQQATSRLELATQRVQRRQYPASQGAVSRDYLDEALTEERNAKDNLQQVQASLQAAKQELARLRNGLRPEEIAQREAAVAEAEAALRLLENGTRSEVVAQRRAAVAAAQAQLKATQVRLEDTLIRAPFTGIVTQKYANDGAYVAPTTSASSSASATSSSIVALAKGLEVLAQVPEADIGRIKVGQPVEITTDAYPDRVFKGRVRLIAPEAVKEEGVTLFQVRIAIDTGEQELRSGLNLDLTFLGDQVNDALLVPTVAIVTEKGNTGVLVPDAKNQPQFRSVVVGAQIKDQTQILEGVNAGDRIFLNPPPNYKREQAQSQT
ncbi:efflux RND transporter periplasmic adaptor subunit [Chlorogloeopsis sp. ULAP02]|uniref:efflux RND transporter periplasmic adaptor subunit n=1 Tax=Chlorogloeopsis sp. ULAP02 TaxID=3107926 RepID=UPI003135E40B